MSDLRIVALAASLLFLAPAIATAQKPAAVAEVQVAPAAIAIQAGNTQQLIAVAYDAAGNVITTAHYRWSSNNLNVARVDSTGTVTAVHEGSAVIRAEALGSGTPLKHGAAVITVRRRAP
jgi:uncharacterized protein YjdB